MKKRTGFFMLLYSFMVFPLIADADVKIYLDETRTGHVMARELDCTVYEGKGGISIGLRAGSMLFNIGPELTLGRKSSIIWDKMVHGIIVRYKELCTRFNAGAVTMKEYKERINEIDKVANEAMAFQENIKKRVRERSQTAFGELERETGGDDFPDSGKIDRRIEEIGKKLKKLPAY